MQVLNSFKNSTSDFKLEADALRDGASLKIIYKITDSKKLLDLPAPFALQEKDLRREDGLWNNTCFEMFIRPVDSKAYHEFNFSLKPAWNEYHFEDYRYPQPPKSCSDYSLKNFHWDGQILSVELNSFKLEEIFEISLTAVLKEKSGAVHYMALKHIGPEADFHHRESFILTR